MLGASIVSTCLVQEAYDGRAMLVAAMSSALEKAFRSPAVGTDENINDANVRKVETIANGIELSVELHPPAAAAVGSIVALKPVRCPAELVASAGLRPHPLETDGSSSLVRQRSWDKWNFGNWFHSVQLQRERERAESLLVILRRNSVLG